MNKSTRLEKFMNEISQFFVDPIQLPTMKTSSRHPFHGLDTDLVGAGNCASFVFPQADERFHVASLFRRQFIPIWTRKL